MWNSRRKLLFFDDKEFGNSFRHLSDIPETSEDSALSAEEITSVEELKFPGIASHGLGFSITTSSMPPVHSAITPLCSGTTPGCYAMATVLSATSPISFVTTPVCSDTTPVYSCYAETKPTSSAFWTTALKPRRFDVGGRQLYPLHQIMTSSSMYKERSITAAPSNARSSIAMATAVTTSRRHAETVELQPLQPDRGPEHFLRDPSEITRLQSEALGARPRTTVTTTVRYQHPVDDTESEYSSVQKLCSLMELQAQISLQQGVQSTSVHHHGWQPASLHPDIHQTRVHQELQPASLHPAIRQTGARHEVQPLNLRPVVQHSSARHGDQQTNIPYVMQRIYSRQHAEDYGTPVMPLLRDSRLDIVARCNFCKRNGERRSFYSSHSLQEHGRVTCPILQRYVCPLCGATGESAHTVSYCPLGNGSSTVAASRTQRKSCGCKRVCKHSEEKHH